MYQIKLRGAQIVKNFNYFFVHGKSISIYPKVSMEEFWPYVKHTIRHDGTYIKNIEYQFPDGYNNVYEFSDIIGYTIIFEFPTEDMAFYFQLIYG